MVLIKAQPAEIVESSAFWFLHDGELFFNVSTTSNGGRPIIGFVLSFVTGSVDEPFISDLVGSKRVGLMRAAKLECLWKPPQGLT